MTILKKLLLVSLTLFSTVSCNRHIDSPITGLLKTHPNPQPISKVPFFPVRGNHEENQDLDYIVNALLPAYSNNFYALNNQSMNYYFDWNNIRFIVIDQYAEFTNGKWSKLGFGQSKTEGDINQLGLEWTENLITSVGPEIEHVFVSFHEPAFPKNRHEENSFDAYPENRNAFWNMLVKHKNIVRAALVGHTHSANRIRVENPENVNANDFPDDPNGIYQVNGGTTGYNDQTNSLVQVEVQGKNINFRILEAKNQHVNYQIMDTWSIINSPSDTTKAWSFGFICDFRNHNEGFEKSLKEIKYQFTNPKFAKVEFVVAGGDMDPFQENYQEIYLKILGVK